MGPVVLSIAVEPHRPVPCPSVRLVFENLNTAGSGSLEGIAKEPIALPPAIDPTSRRLGALHRLGDVAVLPEFPDDGHQFVRVLPYFFSCHR